MNTQTIRSAGSLQDALYALALAKPVPDAAVLDDLVRHYPKYATQLTDMAVELALEALADRGEDPTLEDVRGTSAAVGRAMSRFQNRLYAVTKSQRPANANTAPESPNLLSSLDRAELRGLGSRLGGNTVFAMKLRDRVIDPDTMTEGFRRHVAETMQAPLDVVLRTSPDDRKWRPTRITRPNRSPRLAESKASKRLCAPPDLRLINRPFF